MCWYSWRNTFDHEDCTEGFFDNSSLAADSDQLYERNPYEIHPLLFSDLSDLFSPCRLRDVFRLLAGRYSFGKLYFKKGCRIRRCHHYMADICKYRLPYIVAALLNATASLLVLRNYFERAVSILLSFIPRSSPSTHHTQQPSSPFLRSQTEACHPCGKSQ